MTKLLFGAAYYDEYMPQERLAEDIALMKRAHINTVRIAESTWSTLQPAPDTFDFTSIDRVLAAMQAHDIGVIIGTPTYAVPPWLPKLDSEVMVTTREGQTQYGHRQLMDITNPTFRHYAEQACRKLLAHTAEHPAVIGFQVDNETKYYGVAGEAVQRRFREYMQARFETVENLNRNFGLAYWSNALGSWADFPDMRGCVHAGLAGAFDAFRRRLVTEYLAWQAALVEEYRRPEQFVTHNFDFEWRKFGADIAQDGWSYGVQPQVEHLPASKPFSLAGVDIYHPTQDQLTGAEIAFCGDVIRCLKQQSYLVLETQAQGFKEWTPYPGQLRLHAYSHLATGAMGLLYWNWHSLHNGYETYWKGLLSHDFQPNPTYEEAAVLGEEWERLGTQGVIAKKKNRAALLVSNDALSLLEWFPVDQDLSYNDIVRWVYDTLYRMNIECDVLFAEEAAVEAYDLVVLPALYSASETLLRQLDRYVHQGGTLLATFKTAIADEKGTVWPDALPHLLSSCFGMRHNQYTAPGHTRLANFAGDADLRFFMELLMPEGADTLYRYSEGPWGGFAAATRNRYGAGQAFYVGAYCSEEALHAMCAHAAAAAGIPWPAARWPVILRRGFDAQGGALAYCLNFSAEQQLAPMPFPKAFDLLEGEFCTGETLPLLPWGVCVLRQQSNQ